MRLKIQDKSLVLLVGASGSGKSTFAKAHFAPTAVLSSDTFRGLVADDETDQAATRDAFELLHAVTEKRLAKGLLTVIDATNVAPDARKPLIELARRYHVFAVAIVFKVPEALCQERNKGRADRDFGKHVVRQQVRRLRTSLSGLHHEGLRFVHLLDSVEAVDDASIEITRLWNDRRGECGPFDIVGDVHGCFEELSELLELLGYTSADGLFVPPEGRKAVFVGDLVDRGPNNVAVLGLVMDMVAAGHAICVPGNHDAKLVRHLSGRKVTVAHGLQGTIDELDGQTPRFRERVREFLDSLVSHYLLDEGRLVVAHAGLKEALQGRASRGVRAFALYGQTTGETDEFGLPVRHRWAEEYRGKALVVYGHTPVPEPEWLNNTINIDTGCVFGGRLTALRYPERELVGVDARARYAEPARPIGHKPALSAQHAHDDRLYLEDVSGSRIIETRYHRTIKIREENALAALEVMSRFAVNPKWIIYLPPTMAPAETAAEGDLLERPFEALEYYRRRGAGRAVCEEKHMGSRAVVVVAKDEDAVRRRFGIVGEGIGAIYTRTGRPFFKQEETEQALLARVRDAAGSAGLFDELDSDWLCLDTELMPWSAKAKELVRTRYAAVGAAGAAGLSAAVASLEGVAGGEELRARQEQRRRDVERFRAAYAHYCWEVETLNDYKLAPFHLLASEGAVHGDKSNRWHMQTLHRLCAPDPAILKATPYRIVELDDDASIAEAASWWEELTAAGGEGFVVKPDRFLDRDSRGIVQPALKVRGREYLRIVYGPEYTEPINLKRLRQRHTSRKRSLALREFLLGLEALSRFVDHQPLRRTHECSFGILALESEPVDPRL